MIVTDANVAEWNRINSLINEVALDVNDLLNEMCSTLIDHHFSISTYLNDVEISVSPVEYRHQRRRVI